MRHTARALIALATAALIATAACESDDEPSDEPTDTGAWAACTAFRGLAQHVNDGTLTDDEYRDEAQQIDTYASVADDTSLADAATDLLSTLTQHGYDSTQHAEAVTALNDACTAAGY